MSQTVRPTLTQKSDRLPSLRPPRDVNLVGNQSVASASSSIGNAGTRPRFVPNLALAGKRQATNANDAARSDSKRGSHGRGRGTVGGRGVGDKRRKHEPEIIQSKGIFSDGFNEGVGLTKSSSSSSAYNGSDGRRGADGGGVASKSFVGHRNQAESSTSGKSVKFKSEALETDEMALSELFKDNFISDLAEGDVCPIVLPLSNSEKSEHLKNAKSETDVKNETITDAALFEEAFLRNESSNDDQGAFVFVQLPSVLSSMYTGGSDALGQERTNLAIKAEIQCDLDEKPEITAEEKCEVKRLGCFDGLPQGPLGKLQVLKSGRLRLKLTSNKEDQPIYFDVSLAPTAFAQELVSIQCDNPELNEGSLNVICDKMLHKMFVAPNIDDIISNLKR